MLGSTFWRIECCTKHRYKMRTKLGEGDSPRSLAPGCRLLNLNLIFALTLTGTTKKATTTLTARTMPRKPGDFWLSRAFSFSAFQWEWPKVKREMKR